MPGTQPCLDARFEQDILVLTVIPSQIEGEEIANRLRDELLANVAQQGSTRVILDLKNTRYVSSIAFWPLLALRRHLASQGGRLILCGLTGTVEEVFTTTKMVSSSGSPGAPFEVATDCQAAVARLLA